MQYPVSLEGFEGRQLFIRTAGLVSGPELIMDGQPAPKGPKRGQFLLRRNDGTEVVVQFRTLLLDPIPQLIIDNHVLKVIEPLKWYQWVWAASPILLVFLGGAVGGALGAAATWINVRIFRSEMTPLAQYVAVGAISISAIVAYLVLAILLTIPLRGA